ncbi:heme exporter protein D [Pullulanibacillus pueri]|uniref:Uncharacterized protein n=1 Tax=Pullulanibacillus pueri TaxID=1437324 RepID=A0A8J2ZY87_9BACL|nr:hypothetical protein [Pullulanibacillus pueri]MBM7683178.1 heme exporter protein D [Pullulanibacillus pueri]GGH85660.1 hypothetical protein GCM10007096_31570 [Pullulanibacillus pueri]
MVWSAVISSLIAFIIFVVLIFSFKALLKRNESGFMHLLLALMFTCWLPIPLAVQKALGHPEPLLIGTGFGMLSLILLVFTMVLQASHLSYSAKQAMNHNQALWQERDNWMLGGMLAGTTELFADFLKGVWTVFLTVAFFAKGHSVMGVVGIIYSIVGVISVLLLINQTVVKEMPILAKLQSKLGFVYHNLETFVWYMVLTFWLVLCS